MDDTRHKNAVWRLNDPVMTWDECHVSVLMDIRDELQRLNSLLYCNNAVAIPQLLREIKRNTTPKREKKKATGKE